MRWIVVGLVIFYGAEAFDGDGGRVVHFPKDRCLGRLTIQDADFEREIETFFNWIDGTELEYFGLAQGDVRVPAGKRLALDVTRNYWKDLSGLSKLRADDLYMLSIMGSSLNREQPDDRCMQHIAGLTGLRVLALKGADISNKGLLHIRNMKHLERLYLPRRATNSGMRIVGRLKSLRVLDSGGTRVSSDGMKHLTDLTELEELSLGGEQFDDKALEYAASFGNLQYLSLYGDNFTDAGMAHLKKSKSLRILLIRVSITDEGLRHLSGIKSLENLKVKAGKITNEGMKYLAKAKSLKKLGIGSTQVTDAGLASLRGARSLEYLDLPGEGITNKGLEYLSEFPNLRHLHLPRPCYVDPNRDEKPYTDEGLEHLSKLSKLEDLHVGGYGVTSVGMEYIAKLTNLKRLKIFGCPIGDDGLTKLRGLQSLKKLYLYKTGVTVSGLNQLNCLKNLVNLVVKGLIKNGAVLDISGLTKLEKLTIGTRHGSGEVIDDADFSCLSNLKRLEWVQISALMKDYADYAGLTDEGVAHLSGLVNMDRLTIGGPGLTDEAFSHLRNMKKLHMVNVYGGRFTDRALKHLERLKSLQHITIHSDSKFSDKSLDKLWGSLPNLVNLRVGPPR